MYNNAVENVLAGMTADGTGTLSKRVGFTKDAATRRAAQALLERVLERISGTLDDGQVTQMTVKLLGHLRKRGLQAPEALAGFDAMALADAVAENPSALHSKVTVAGLLRGHAQRNARESRRLRACAILQAPPRPVLWEGKGVALVEVTDPRHLQEDSAALKHCAGTALNTDELKANGLNKNDPDAIHALEYWLKVKSGKSRIFTLMTEAPLLTIEYDVRFKTIRQMRGRKNKDLPNNHPHFASLCEALHHLRMVVPIRGINGLPQSKIGCVVTRGGAIARAALDNVQDALGGFVYLPADAQEAFIKRVLNNALLWADVTHLPQKRLDGFEDVAASLVSDAETVTLPNLKRCGGQSFENATTVVMPNLMETGDLYYGHAMTIEMPSLVTSCKNFFMVAKTVSLPSLVTSIMNNFIHTETIRMPNMVESGDNMLSSARAISLPKLRHSRTNYIPAAKSVFLPKLETSMRNDFRSAKTIVLPKWWQHDIRCPDDAEFYEGPGHGTGNP